MKRTLSSALILGLSFPAVGCRLRRRVEDGEDGNDHDAGWVDHHKHGDQDQINRR